MEIKVTDRKAGNEHLIQVEVSDKCDIKELDTVIRRINQVVENVTRSFESTDGVPASNRSATELNHAPVTPHAELPTAPTKKSFIPPSDKAMGALYGACKSNGMDVSTVCKQFGVDPDNISKDDCRRMTSDLNDKSGYSKIQQSRRQNRRNAYRFPNADKLPDDSDVFGK